ncbi:hypothetical protein [Gemmata massiliana]|uniref:hypothetical protein n=1 Tax=Gemmata massiliana TaxID=1210884 RepID=UPI0013A6C45D|nr:hypothetical protein [Gemmata massiliana]
MREKYNQTDPQWLAQPHLTQGTGIFLVPDIHSAAPESVKKEYVENITYEECIRRGKLALVVKWVPHTVLSFADLKANACGQNCVDTCAEPGCECWSGKCR